MVDKGNNRKNRLSEEKSPYLLQHAKNPVDWYPWGDEAFDKALKEDKPVFLSIGYSTCHWCHVMERESFEDEDIADLLNDSCVSIKVDREERPEIDQLYMKVAQMATGTGGWPLNLFLTPDRRPFYVATYIPRDSRYGTIGMSELVPNVAKLWKENREKLLSSANSIVTILENEPLGEVGKSLDRDVFVQTYDELMLAFDEKKAGFGTRPKFPSPHNILFLLRYWKRDSDPYALKMAQMTLDAMARGGIRDHIGGGFHRYSTDKEWKLPHFEKMLYDQAMLSIAYSEAYQETGKPLYKEIVIDIIEYVKERMMSEEGCFYSAEDADSDGIEGAFYVWSYKELEDLLNSEELGLLKSIYHIGEGGNFDDEATRTPSGLNILYMDREIDTLSADLLNMIKEIHNKLLERRYTRTPPLKDDKVLTDWNGLMTAALAIASRTLGNEEYANMARKCIDFLYSKMFDDEGTLLHRYREGESAIEANLDDYAFLAWGLLELYDVSFDSVYLQRAKKLVDVAIEMFWDERQGGFYFAPSTKKDLISRQRDAYDGAMPSGNSVMTFCLWKISRLLGEEPYEQKAYETVAGFFDQIKGRPSAHTFLMMAYDGLTAPCSELVIAGDMDEKDTLDMISARNSAYLPHNNTIVLKDESRENYPGYTNEMRPVDGKATAYVCIEKSCMRPTTSIEEMMTHLKEIYS